MDKRKSMDKNGANRIDEVFGDYMISVYRLEKTKNIKELRVTKLHSR